MRPPSSGNIALVQRRFVQVMHSDDNVAMALLELTPGMVLHVPRDAGQPDLEVTVHATIPFGHKVALLPIAAGEPVRKYGEMIGRASSDIRAGEHVHTHNVESQRGRGDLAARQPD
jgi:altronate dehydratase small subunit